MYYKNVAKGCHPTPADARNSKYSLKRLRKRKATPRMDKNRLVAKITDHQPYPGTPENHHFNRQVPTSETNVRNDHFLSVALFNFFVLCSLYLQASSPFTSAPSIFTSKKYRYYWPSSIQRPYHLCGARISSGCHSFCLAMAIPIFILSLRSTKTAR